jgi:putative transposase
MPRLPSWAISDAFWKRVEPLLPQPTRDPNKSYIWKKSDGRKPLDYRKVFEGIVYVLRTGCQWKALPKEVYGSPTEEKTLENAYKVGAKNSMSR